MSYYDKYDECNFSTTNASWWKHSSSLTFKFIISKKVSKGMFYMLDQILTI